jgi:hypothetical protein
MVRQEPQGRTSTILPSRPLSASCTSTTKLLMPVPILSRGISRPPIPLSPFTTRSKSSADEMVSAQSTQTYSRFNASRNARVTVLFPVPGNPVRHNAGGLGSDGWPRTDAREENCASRQGYVSFSSLMTASRSMVMVTGIANLGDPFHSVDSVSLALPLFQISSTIAMQLYTLQRSCSSRQFVASRFGRLIETSLDPCRLRFD